MQQPRNYLRTTFASRIDPCIRLALFAALNIWLIWLEPWVTQSKLKNTRALSVELCHSFAIVTRDLVSSRRMYVIRPIFSDARQRIIGSVSRSSVQSQRPPLRLRFSLQPPSKYTPAGAYVLAIFTSYTVPTIFLRRARELDFSGR
jgi:hypothetical protein